MSRAVLCIVLMMLSPEWASAADARSAGAAVRALSPAVRWLAAAQRPDGGWNAAPRETEPGHEQDDHPPLLPEADSDVPDTCMASLALLRAGGSLYRPPFGDDLRRALRFVLDAVDKSEPTALFLSQTTMPLSPRLGNHIDTFLALQLLAQVRGQCESELRERVNGAIEKLLTKMKSNEKEDGTWGTAGNAPMLGHALGVRALETASRAGIDVDANVIVKAEKWAMSTPAEKDEWKHNGTWRRQGASGRFVGENPANYEYYLMAARLQVLAQADRTNELEEPAVRKRFMAGKDPQELAAVMRQLGSIQTTHKTFARAEEDMLNALPRSGAAGPEIFCGEDFLGTLFIIDSLDIDAPRRCLAATTAKVASWQTKEGKFDSPHFSGETVFCTAAGIITLLDANKPAEPKTRPAAAGKH